MKVIETTLPDVKLLEPDVFGDERGFFMETWQQKRFASQVADVDFVQDNYSFSSRNTLRGIHYQIEQSQGKLIKVVSGEVLDVAVDLRRSSPTFGSWIGEILSVDNKRQLWVPPGFGHAFIVLSETAGFEYKCTDYYAPEHERSIRWDDPDLGIDWRLEPGEQPKLSQKDAEATAFKEADVYE